MGTTLGEAWVHIFGDLSGLDKDLDSAEKKTESSAGNMAKLLGGAIVGGAAIAGAAIIGIGTEAFNVASDIDKATDQIGASLGLTDEQAKKFGDTIKTVYGDNFGDSIEDVGASIETVAKQLHLTADDPALKKITENAYRLKDVFGVEVNESIDAVKTLMEQFGVTADEAFDHLSNGYQRGLDRSGDLLDTIGEYSVQFAEGDASITEFFSALDTGLQGGMLGTDKAADAFKEFRVRIADGSTTTKTALEQIGLSAETITNGLADGSITVKDAWDLVQRALADAQDPVIQMQAGVGLIGTQFEDLGAKVVLAMDLTDDWAEGGLNATSDLDSKYTNLGSVFEGMWRQFQVGIAPAGEAILGFVNENLPAFQGAVSTATGIIVTAIGYIPLAFAAVKTAWNTDWADIRTTWDNFAKELPIKQAAFWEQWNTTFNTGSGENKVKWEAFWGVVWGGVLRYLGLIIDNWTLTLRIFSSSFGAFSALFHGDWKKMWNETYTFWTSILGQFIGFIDVFWPSFGAKLTGAFTGALDEIKSSWQGFVDWWNSTVGSIPGVPSFGGGSPPPNLGVVNPKNTPQQTIQDILQGSGGFGQAVGQSSVGNITLNQHFHGQADSRTVKDATSDGVLNASRRLGLR